MKRKIKLFEPSIGKDEENAIKRVLKSKFWASGAGTGKVLEFEKKFKKYVKSNTCIAVNSGTAALNLAVSLIPIKGKEVILPSLSFVSTAHAIMYNGGIPVFVDVDPHTLCIDPEEIKKKISKNLSEEEALEIFKDIGLFDENIPVCEDYDLWLRICSRYPVLYLQDKLIKKYGGHDDQLSRQYWGMDRFRIRALEKMINDPVLSENDRKATVATAINKARILQKGLMKHSHEEEAEKMTKKLAELETLYD